MEAKVTWTRAALSSLDEIYEYYLETSETVAENMVNKLYFSDKPLRTFPYAGSIEPLLKNRKMVYRSLVVERHFKLIYCVENGDVFIMSVWDTRRNPDFLSRMIK